MTDPAAARALLEEAERHWNSLAVVTRDAGWPKHSLEYRLAAALRDALDDRDRYAKALQEIAEMKLTAFQITQASRLARAALSGAALRPEEP